MKILKWIWKKKIQNKIQKIVIDLYQIKIIKEQIYQILFILYFPKRYMQKYIMLGVKIVMSNQVLKVLKISEMNYYQEIIKILKISTLGQLGQEKIF